MLTGNFNKGAARTLALVVALLAAVPAAGAQVFFSVRDLLSDQFKHSDRVTYVQVRPNAAQRARIAQRLGHELTKGDYTFYVATTRGQVDGYALFDEERGQHEPITFATFFDATGNVTRVEVVAYREAYGDAIRGERFRKQFIGRDALSGFVPGHDIDAVSGATISSRSMCTGVERASVLLEETVLKARTEIAAR